MSARPVPEPPRPLDDAGLVMWLAVHSLGEVRGNFEPLLRLCELLDERAVLRARVMATNEWRDRVGLRALDSQIDDALDRYSGEAAPEGLVRSDDAALAVCDGAGRAGGIDLHGPRAHGRSSCTGPAHGEHRDRTDARGDRRGGDHAHGIALGHPSDDHGRTETDQRGRRNDGARPCRGVGRRRGCRRAPGHPVASVACHRLLDGARHPPVLTARCVP